MNINFKSRDFVHLHVHSDYSLLQSAIQLKPLAKRLQELEMKACAITDFGNLFGAISFYNTMKAAEIIRYRLRSAPDFRQPTRPRSPADAGERPFYNLVLLAKNLEGIITSLIWRRKPIPKVYITDRASIWRF
jgi:DNA polymerase-3 subunit alpha